MIGCRQLALAVLLWARLADYVSSGGMMSEGR